MLGRSRSQVILLITALLLLASFGFSQQQKPLKIGIVNSQAVLEKSIEGKRVMNQLSQKDQENQKKLAQMDEEIRQLESKLNTQRMTLSSEALMQLTSDLEKRKTARQRFAEDSYREIQDLTNRLFNKIQRELLPIIEQIGKDLDLDVIFDLRNSGAIYFNPRIDITEEVIKRYDASKKSGK